MNLLLFIFGQGPWEIFLIFFAILLLFGGRKIPELMKGIGKGIREFNNARSSIEQELKEGMRESEREEERLKLDERLRAEERQKMIEQIRVEERQKLEAERRTADE